jgi:hypothetical protein
MSGSNSLTEEWAASAERGDGGGAFVQTPSILPTLQRLRTVVQTGHKFVRIDGFDEVVGELRLGTKTPLIYAEPAGPEQRRGQVSVSTPQSRGQRPSLLRSLITAKRDLLPRQISLVGVGGNIVPASSRETLPVRKGRITAPISRVSRANLSAKTTLPGEKGVVTSLSESSPGEDVL